MAVYENGTRKKFLQKEKVLVGDLKVLFKKFPIEYCIISSVKKTNPKYLTYLRKRAKTYFLNSNLPLPIENKYGTPKTLGNDRLAAVVGAHSEFPNKNNLVIDLGTCVKFDFIDKSGVYHGGNIAPGVNMRLEAMHHFTAALPSIKKKKVKSLLGNSTSEAMNNGAVLGVALEIESFIRRLKKEKGSINVILTGGDAAFFGEIVKSKIFVDSYILLTGLNKILEHQKDIY